MNPYAVGRQGYQSGMGAFYGKAGVGGFEPDQGGNWHCRKTVTVRGPLGDVVVKAGARLAPHTVFAGFDDFTSYLEKIIVTMVWLLA